MCKKLFLLLCAVVMLCTRLFAAEYVADQVVIFKCTPTSDLKLHIFYPDNHKAGNDSPVVVSFFGGGWVGGTAQQFFEQSEYYASLGVVGISAEYRVKQRDKTTPFECVADGKSAIRWVRAHAEELGVDPDRIVASGGSAGGHVAVCTALIDDFDDENDSSPEVSSVPNAMVLFNPVVNTTAEGCGKENFNGDELTLSPTHHVRKNMPPALIFHGSQDSTVPFGNAVEFVKLMELYGNDVRFEVGFGENHSFFNGKSFRENASAQHYAKSMYEVTKFLMELDYIPKRDLAKPEAIRVACVGDAAASSAGQYPAYLQRLLGDDYSVKNFVCEGATVLANGGKPFANSEEYKELYAYEADVIIFMLGANDLKSVEWTEEAKKEFVAQYINMAKRLQNNPANMAQVYFCKPMQLSGYDNDAIGIMVEQVAQQMNRLVTNIDTSELSGKRKIAKYIYDKIANTEAQEAKVERSKKIY